MKDFVSVIIPTYNRKKDVLECIGSVTNQTFRNYEIIVVDNASTDGSSETIKRLYPSATIVQSANNLGVTGGRNLGAKIAKGDLLLFLDNDIILSTDALEEMVRAIRSDVSIGIAGCLIFSYDFPSEIWAAGSTTPLTTGLAYFNKPSVTDLAKEFIDVQGVPAVILTKREMLKRIGLFDEDYFAVWEDTEFCHRARKDGYRIICVLTTKALHKIPWGGRGSGMDRLLSRSYYLARNRTIFLRKYAKLPNFLAYIMIFMQGYMFYYLVHALRTKRIASFTDYLRGTVAGLIYSIKNPLQKLPSLNPDAVLGEARKLQPIRSTAKGRNYSK